MNASDKQEILTAARELVDAALSPNALQDLPEKAANAHAIIDKLEAEYAIRYPWESAPEWAMWAATDESGASHWFEDKPYEFSGADEWLLGAPCAYALIRKDSLRHNWRNSLEPRPPA